MTNFQDVIITTNQGSSITTYRNMKPLNISQTV